MRPLTAGPAPILIATKDMLISGTGHYLGDMLLPYSDWQPVSWRDPPFGGDQGVAQSVNFAIDLDGIRNRAGDLLA